MFRGRVHGVSLSCGARVGRGFGHVGGAHVGVRDRLYVAGEAKRRERGGNRWRGASSQTVCSPPLVFACVFTRALPVVYLCGSRMVVWAAAASPLTTVPLLCSMVRPWCEVRPL